MNVRQRRLGYCLFAYVSTQLSSYPAFAEDNKSTENKLIDYTVVAKDNCSRIAKKLYGDTRFIELVHQNNPLGPKPHRLRPGQVLRLPASASAVAAVPLAPDAKLTFVRNQVEAYTPEYHRGQKDEPLGRGNRVSTLDQSSAEITFRDESQLALGEHTLVVIFGDGAGEAQASRRPRAGETTLLRGALLARLGELAGEDGKAAPAAIATPGARVTFAPGAGEARLHVDEKRTTRLAVYRGSTRLGAAGRTVEVKSGFGSTAELGKPPTPPRPLPGQPLLTKWPALRLSDGRPIDVEGLFAPGPGPAPAGYHVQLARDAAMNDLVLDARVPASTTRLEARAVPPGDYFARVSAVDSEGFEGPPSATARLQVQRVNQVVDAEPGAMTARVEPPPGLRCELDGKSLSGAAVPVRATEPHRLRCVPPGGAEADALELTLPALRDEPEPPPAPLLPQAAPIARPVEKPPEPAEVPLVPPELPQPGEPVTARRWFATITPRLGGRFGLAGQLGISGGAELGVLRRLPFGALTAGLRVEYEYVSADGLGPLHQLNLPLPITYLVGRIERWRVAPYLGVVPEVLSHGVALSPGLSVRRYGFAIGGVVGLSLRLWRGGALIEGGYRHVVTDGGLASDPALPSASGLSCALGYRFLF